jgi:hypothetical protein
VPGIGKPLSRQGLCVNSPPRRTSAKGGRKGVLTFFEVSARIWVITPRRLPQKDYISYHQPNRQPRPRLCWWLWLWQWFRVARVQLFGAAKISSSYYSPGIRAFFRAQLGLDPFAFFLPRGVGFWRGRSHRVSGFYINTNSLQFKLFLISFLYRFSVFFT